MAKSRRFGRRDFLLYRYGRDGAGVDIGAEPGALPVVLGGVAGRGDIGELIGALPVVVLGVLLAVLGLLFQPAIRMIAIKTTTAMPAIQPHMPPDVSGRRSTGSLNRWSKRGSDMASSLVVRTSPLVHQNGPRPSVRKPAGDTAGSEIIKNASRQCGTRATSSQNGAIMLGKRASPA
jgi:hypothetical protein